MKPILKRTPVHSLKPPTSRVSLLGQERMREKNQELTKVKCLQWLLAISPLEHWNMCHYYAPHAITELTLCSCSQRIVSSQSLEEDDVEWNVTDLRLLFIMFIPVFGCTSIPTTFCSWCLHWHCSYKIDVFLF